GCREGTECPGPITPPPAQDCPRCVDQPSVCSDGPLVGQACDFDTQCPGKQKSIDPTTGTIICEPGNCGACDITRPRNDDQNPPVLHTGTCFAGPRAGLWCDLDGECPSTCGQVHKETCRGGNNDGQDCTSDRDCIENGQCTDGKLDVCQGPTVLHRTGSY